MCSTSSYHTVKAFISYSATQIVKNATDIQFLNSFTLRIDIHLEYQSQYPSNWLPTGFVSRQFELQDVTQKHIHCFSTMKLKPILPQCWTTLYQLEFRIHPLFHQEDTEHQL